jgi:hypothetical protein
VAVKGTYSDKYNEKTDKLGYQQEFKEAFLFADKYAGYHASPEISLGAWIAFRENDTILANNPNVQPSARKLSVFTGDYNFLMKRLPDKTTGEHNVGPDNQRFGAWARILPAGESMQLNINEQFVSSLKECKILVTYLDQTNTNGNSFKVTAGSLSKTFKFENNGIWHTVCFELKPGSLTKGADDTHIRLTAGSGSLILHMVEVVRK